MEAQTKAIPLSEFNKSKLKNTITFILNHQNPNPSMMRVAGNTSLSMTGTPVQFPNHFGLPNECQIFENGNQRIIRYAIGEKSIYKDEQSDDTKVPKKKQKIEFINGILNVKKYETQLLEFMRKCEWNGSNTNRTGDKQIFFYEYNPQAGAKDLVARESAKMKAKHWCFNADWIDLKSYAMVLSVDVDRDPEEVKWEMSILADRDPATFMEGLKNKSTQRKYIILEAIQLKVIVEDKRQGLIKWVNGNTISQAPTGKDAVDHLVGLTFNNADGELLYEAIKDAVLPKISGAPQENKKENVHKIHVDMKAIDVLVERAIACGVFKRAGAWIKYTEDEKWQGRGVHAVLAQNETVKNAVIADIEKAEAEKAGVPT